MSQTLDFDHIATELSTAGWVVVEDFLPADSVAQVRADAVRLQSSFKEAAVGRGDDRTQTAAIRRDKTLWLEPTHPPQKDVLARLETLRFEINQRLMLGLFEVEAHYAIYKPGGFYKRHVDSFRGARNRLLSLVLYLNEAWTDSDGGQLALYAPDSSEDAPPLVTLQPKGGRAVLFLSEEIPHEVMPSHRTRYSIAAWMRVKAAAF